LPGSLAKIFASRGSVSLAKRIFTVVAPSTTCAFVKISPSAVSTTPVPVASPELNSSETWLEIVTTLSAIALATCAITVSPTAESLAPTALVTIGVFDEPAPPELPIEIFHSSAAIDPPIPPAKPISNIDNTSSNGLRRVPALWV